jgi:hypothetical protein
MRSSCSPFRMADRAAYLLSTQCRTAVRGRHATEVGRFGMLISARDMNHPWSDHLGMISGRSPGHFEIVASSTFKCWATISGGECVSQSDNDTSS